MNKIRPVIYFYQGINAIIKVNKAMQSPDYVLPPATIEFFRPERVIKIFKEQVEMEYGIRLN